MEAFLQKLMEFLPEGSGYTKLIAASVIIFLALAILFITRRSKFERNYGKHHCNGYACNKNFQCNEPERYFCRTVLLAIVPKELIKGQYQLSDKKNAKRIDFAIINKNKKIAIEFDGYKYHAKLSVSEFNYQIKRQNELVTSGWIVLRFSYHQLTKENKYCKETIRKALEDL